jgi:phosphocarrier protein HPr
LLAVSVVAKPMPETKLVLANEVGLHARPAAQFVKTAAKFKSNIKILKDGNMADAKSITSILFLDARKGDEIIIRAIGEDAKDALEALTKLVNEF